MHLNLALVTLACVALPWRNRYPEPVLAVALLAFVATGTPAPAMLAMGSLAAVHGSRVRTSIAAGAASVVVVVAELDNPDPLRPLLVWGVLVCLPTAVGLYLLFAARPHRRGRRPADALAAAQHTLAESARRDERTRIAREMHDVVAHQVSLIALHAGALELTEQGTPAGKTAELIRQTARQALDELRTVVTVLRTEPGDDERSPQATIAGLEDTVEESRKAGTEVTLHDRTFPGFLDTLSARAGRTAYRIVREALTNASKHAPGSIIEIELDDVDGSLEVVVHSSPATRVSSAPRPARVPACSASASVSSCSGAASRPGPTGRVVSGCGRCSRRARVSCDGTGAGRSSGQDPGPAGRRRGARPSRAPDDPRDDPRSRGRR